MSRNIFKEYSCNYDNNRAATSQYFACMIVIFISHVYFVRNVSFMVVKKFLVIIMNVCKNVTYEFINTDQHKL